MAWLWRRSYSRVPLTPAFRPARSNCWLMTSGSSGLPSGLQKTGLGQDRLSPISASVWPVRPLSSKDSNRAGLMRSAAILPPPRTRARLRPPRRPHRRRYVGNLLSAVGVHAQLPEAPRQSERPDERRPPVQASVGASSSNSSQGWKDGSPIPVPARKAFMHPGSDWNRAWSAANSARLG